jgi:hypothetical protein
MSDEITRFDALGWGRSFREVQTRPKVSKLGSWDDQGKCQSGSGGNARVYDKGMSYLLRTRRQDDRLVGNYD